MMSDTPLSTLEAEALLLSQLSEVPFAVAYEDLKAVEGAVDVPLGDTHYGDYGDGFVATNMSTGRSHLLKTSAIRGTYRFAEYWNDNGRKVPGSGYEPTDRIGHAVIGTVRGLCDEVDRLRGLILAAIDDCEEETGAPDGNDYQDGLKDQALSTLRILRGGR